MAQDQVLREQYLLRSTFFYNRLHSEGYFKLFRTVVAFVKAEDGKFDWTRREQWSISEEAWGMIQKSKISPLLVFLHPKVLSLYPTFLKYYRSVCMISQKGLQAVARVSSVNNIEVGKVEPGKVSTQTAERIVGSINEIMSAVITVASGLSRDELQGMMYATAGTKIDGSWRNQIGNEGERVVRSIIFKELLDLDEISSVVNRKSEIIEIAECDTKAVLEDINMVRVINVRNGYSMLFSSEPDITMYDAEGKVVGVIEIKAGLDPAGALERLGAMLKSFENTLAEYPNAVTILVASCLTEEADARLDASMVVRQKYFTTRITANDREKRKFVNRLRAIMKLVK